MCHKPPAFLYRKEHIVLTFLTNYLFNSAYNDIKNTCIEVLHSGLNVLRK